MVIALPVGAGRGEDHPFDAERGVIVQESGGGREVGGQGGSDDGDRRCRPLVLLRERPELGDIGGDLFARRIQDDPAPTTL